MPAWDDVFTADEVARATGVPVSAVAALVASGELRPLPGTRFFAGHDVIRATWRLRATAVSSTPASIRAFFARSGNGGQPAPSPRPFLASCAAHVVLFIAALALSSGSPQTVATAVTDPPDGLVYLMMPGPGGGGGGSGARERRPPARIARIGTDAVSVPVLQPEPAVSRESSDTPAPSPEPAPVEDVPEPPAPPAVAAPLAPTKSASDERNGVLETESTVASAGPGAGDNTGAGRGAGVGDGTGAGIGAGAGGGIGGGPYRPGSGIQPPKLLREVKADYSEEARRRGISGDVILEIVVRQDGRVGDITVLRGLGAGLDQRATAAVRQWLFSPAMRMGTPVDVLVEVAVEFSLR